MSNINHKFNKFFMFSYKKIKKDNVSQLPYFSLSLSHQMFRIFLFATMATRKCDNDKKKMFYLKNFKIDFGATMTRGDNDNEKYGIYYPYIYFRVTH